MRAMRSIQTKFIALILSTVLFSSAIIGGAGILNAKKAVDQDSAQIMNLLCGKRADEINARLSRIEQSVETLAIYATSRLESVDALINDKEYLDAYTLKLEEIAVNISSSTSGAISVYTRFNPDIAPPTSGFFWSKNDVTGQFQKLPPTDFSQFSPNDTARVGWYYIPVAAGKATWMAPYMNENINVRMISYVIPLYTEHKVVGVVGMDIDFDIITQEIAQMQAYESGYAFLVDKNGYVMYHKGLPSNVLMSDTDSSLVPVVNALERGSSDTALFPYFWKGDKKMMAFRSLANGMRLALTAPTDEIDAVKNDLILQTSLATVIISWVAVLFTIVYSRRIVRPLRELDAAAKKIAAGDLSISLVPQTQDEVGTLTLSFQQTVAHLQKYINYINGLAYRDALTGVKNKTAYQDAVQRLEEEMRVRRPEFAVLVCDLNGLKVVNDSMGHDFGDILITDACRIISQVFKRSPVYRVGGDEFVVILEGTDFDNYPELLDNLQASVEQHNLDNRGGPRLSIARGIALYAYLSDLVFNSVFKRADDAMYQNKAAVKAREAAASASEQ